MMDPAWAQMLSIAVPTWTGMAVLYYKVGKIEQKIDNGMVLNARNERRKRLR